MVSAWDRGIMARKRKRKSLNHKRRVKALENAEPGAVSNPAALALALRFRNRGRHTDARKESARRACRGKVSY